MNTNMLKNQGSNQTLNHGEINNNTIPGRKIRIIVYDPYATESSDADESDHRRIVHEIFLPNVDDGEKSSSVEGSGEVSVEGSSEVSVEGSGEVSLEGSGEVSVANSNRVRGVRRRKSCKWTPEIRDPFKKRRVYLGSSGSGEEAEFSQRRDPQSFQGVRRRKNGRWSAKPKIKKVEEEGSSGTEIKRFRGVRRRKSGRWSAEIRDPFKKTKVFLGTFDTGEEASKVFEAKKVEFRERLEAQSAMDIARIETDSSNHSKVQIEAEMNWGSILIDNNGFLLGEFSNLDDDLTISE